MLLQHSAVRSAPRDSSRLALRKSAQSACDRAQFRVVIDVGHSAEVPGAMSARGTPEYEFNLQLANRIGKDLAAAGFRQANVLVTPGPAKRSLFMRVAHAANLTADLFISIHHDSVPERFLKTLEYEGKQLRYSDYFRGHSIFMSYENAYAAARSIPIRLASRRLNSYSGTPRALMAPGTSAEWPTSITTRNWARSQAD